MDFQNTDSDDKFWETFRFKEIAYVRPILNQYGGNTYDVRSKQQYISINHYQPIVSNNSTAAITLKVFGRDTFVNYRDQEYIHQYQNKEQAVWSHYIEPRDR